MYTSLLALLSQPFRFVLLGDIVHYSRYWPDAMQYGIS